MRLFSLALIAALSSCKTRVVEKVVVAEQPAAADSTTPKDESKRKPNWQETLPEIAKETPEAPLGPNEWRDPVSNSRWLLTGYSSPCSNKDDVCQNLGDQGQKTCSSDWRYPAMWELKSAMNHGLQTALPSPHQFAWTVEGFIVGRHNGRIDSFGNVPEEPRSKDLKYTPVGLYCIWGPVPPAP